MKIKYIVLCLLLALVGCQREEDMEIVNATINNERIDPSYSSVSISCNINCNATINQVKAYISITTDFSNAQTQLLVEQKKGTYAAKINGLANTTTYYVRYKISNNYSSFILDKTSQFKTIPFTTPTMQTNEVTDVTYNSAIVGGTIKENGGQEIKECGIVYSKSSNPTIENGTKVESNITKEAYTCILTNLDFATTYYARAYAINAKGTAYGEEVSFKTNGTTASLDTLSISDVTATSAVISGALLNNGGESITALGICYGVNQSPTLEDATVVNAELDGLKFSVLLNDLQKGTTYYVRAYVTNSHGTVYSDELYFNTEMTIPAVTTAPATDISYTSATVGGNVTDDGGAEVTERGVVYSTSQNPTTLDNKVTSGSGLGSFSCNLTELQNEMTYYIRAYAVNEKGTAYGEEVSFTTKAKTVATVSTTEPTSIIYTSAVVGGTVTDDGGAEVTERGVVYSTSQNPTTSDNKVTSGSGTGSFSCNLTELQDGVTYYARAYAVNEKGTAYGEEVSFTTLCPFSISSTRQVIFSSGNLQYHPANDAWRFAESQLDCIGDANSNCSSTYNGWIDLFGWSTSSTNFGVSTSEDYADYYGSFVDWGTNQIGADAPNTWRTLTFDEWNYVVFNRPNAGSLKGVAQVNGVNGLILLPDDWTCPAGIIFKSGFHGSNGVDDYAAYQTFTTDQWSELEGAGAVFLPAAGYRLGSNVYDVLNYGRYWSATEYNSRSAYCLYFYSGEAYMNGGGRNGGRGVRLVKDL